MAINEYTLVQETLRAREAERQQLAGIGKLAEEANRLRAKTRRQKKEIRRLNAKIRDMNAYTTGLGAVDRAEFARFRGWNFGQQVAAELGLDKENCTPAEILKVLRGRLKSHH